MGVQSTFNQALATTGFLLSQSPEMQDRAEVRKLIKQRDNLNQFYEQYAKKDLAEWKSARANAEARGEEFKPSEELIQGYKRGNEISREELGLTKEIAKYKPNKMITNTLEEGKIPASRAYYEEAKNQYFMDEDYSDVSPIEGAQKANLKAQVAGLSTAVQSQQTLTRRELIQQMREEGTLHKRSARRALNRLKYTEEKEAK